MEEPSQAVKITILVVTLAVFAAGAIFFFVFGRKFRWPDGDRIKRRTPGGTDLTIIFGPGMGDLLVPGMAAKVSDACRLAIDSCFIVWNKYRPHDRAEEAFDHFAVEFVTDEEIDARAAAFWGKKDDGAPRQRVNGYLWTVKRQQWGEEIPCAVIRGSLFQLVIDKGKPVVHETVHALLGEFSQAEGGNREHTHEAWDLVWIPAERVYADRVSRAAST